MNASLRCLPYTRAIYTYCRGPSHHHIRINERTMYVAAHSLSLSARSARYSARGVRYYLVTHDVRAQVEYRAAKNTRKTGKKTTPENVGNSYPNNEIFCRSADEKRTKRKNETKSIHMAANKEGTAFCLFFFRIFIFIAHYTDYYYYCYFHSILIGIIYIFPLSLAHFLQFLSPSTHDSVIPPFESFILTKTCTTFSWWIRTREV